jgi:hypothetical protein
MGNTTIPTADIPAKPKPKLRWYQFSLRTLLLFVTLFACACSWFAVKMRQAKIQKETVEKLEKFGCDIEYDWEMRAPKKTIIKSTIAPRWLQKLLGADFFSKVTGVDTDQHFWGDEEMLYFKGLPDLQTISIHNAGMTDAGLESLKDLAELRILNISIGMNQLDDYQLSITDAGLKHLRGLRQLINLNLTTGEITGDGLENFAEMTQLEYLYICVPHRADAGLAHLKGLKNLQKLWFTGSDLTDAGLASLKELTGLREINLAYSPITDAGLRHLKGLSQLQDLSLHNTQISDAGLEEISGLVGLEQLNIRFTRTTDAGLNTLKG